MPDAYPMLVRCARHQLREDKALYAHLLERHRQHAFIRPNLMMLTGPAVWRAPSGEHGTLVPILCVKAG